MPAWRRHLAFHNIDGPLCSAAASLVYGWHVAAALSNASLVSIVSFDHDPAPARAGWHIGTPSFTQPFPLELRASNKKLFGNFTDSHAISHCNMITENTPALCRVCDWDTCHDPQ